MSPPVSLIAPRQLREELFDYLSEQTNLVTGFTASDAAGHGAEVRLHTVAERVKGHADQVVVRVILQKIDADLIFDRLRVSFAGTKLVYWILPVKEFGTIDKWPMSNASLHPDDAFRRASSA